MVHYVGSTRFGCKTFLTRGSHLPLKAHAAPAHAAARSGLVYGGEDFTHGVGEVGRVEADVAVARRQLRHNLLGLLPPRDEQHRRPHPPRPAVAAAVVRAHAGVLTAEGFGEGGRLDAWGPQSSLSRAVPGTQLSAS